MQDIQTLIASLRRPSLLVTAARHGADIYDRKRDLAPLLRNDALRRHVGLLSAILAEARALSA